jgi:hypothetical protein
MPPEALMSRIHRNHPRRHVPALALTTLAAAGLLAACGGGSGGDTAAAPEPTAPANPVSPAGQVSITGVVAVASPLQGATVCLDLDANARCDGGEPSTTTGADGRYALAVDPAQAGRHALVAQVPATAIDVGSGAAVGQAFALSAPATGDDPAQPQAITPLTRAVAQLAAWAGLPVADAAAAVQRSLGLDASPLDGGLGAADAPATRLALALHALTLRTAALADGAAVPPDAAQALQAAVGVGHLRLLSALATADASAAPAALADQVLARRQLSADSVATQAAVALATSGAQPARTGPFATPRRFSWTNAGNYSYFAFEGDGVADADGATWASEVRSTVVNGQAQPFNRNTAYLDRRSGQWVVCDNGWRTRRDLPANDGRPQQLLYCAGQHIVGRVADADVSGRRMADVVAQMRAWPLADSVGTGTDSRGLPVHWGPPPSALGEAVFPEGSVITTHAQLTDFGGTERYILTDKPRVAPPGGTGSFRQAATLGDFERMTGNLVKAEATVDGSNTIFLEDVPATVTDPVLRAVTRHRVGFDPASDAVRFYACEVVDATNATRNCTALGDGRRRIDAVADSRVLRFTDGYPAALTVTHQRQRLFVERHGAVFGGYHDLERMVHSQRPNAVAWQALRSALALPDPAPPKPPAVATAGTTLRSFTYTDAGNFRARLFDFDTAVLDAAGYSPVNERFLIRSGGQAQAFERNQLFWTGSQWYACPSDGRAVIRTRQAAPFDTVYCDTYVDDVLSTATMTLDGRNMAEVVRDIRAFGSKDGSFDYAGWGPNPDVHTQLSRAVFPAGATLSYRSNQVRATPMALALGAANVVRLPRADLAFSSWPVARTLEEVVVGYRGDYVGSGGATSSNALFVGSRTADVAPGPDYTTLIEMRVGFDPATQKASFYRNYRLRADNSVAATTRVLETGYRIETLGDARLLKFDALPEGFEQDFGYARFFAQWGGAVVYGFKNAVPSTPSHSIRLNGIAADALFQALGVN